MLISKFNKLIRNKFVWAIFAILVSLSMVGLFAPQPREARERRGDGLGTLFGEDVGRDAFVRTRLFVQSFQPVRGGEDVQRMVDEETWARLATLRYAENLGLRVSTAELVDTIQGDPSFQENGSFSMPRYQFLIEQQLGIPVGWFEEYIRQEILLDRVRELLEVSLWIPASELEENTARFTDTYDVAFVLVTPDEADVVVDDVGEEDARRVYAESAHTFEVPERRRVVYVKFPHAAHLDPEEISMRQIEARYESDPERFTYRDPEMDIILTQPLEEVADEIRQELAEQEAVAVASEHAMRLVDELSLADRDAAVGLGALADGMGQTVSTSAWFEVSGPVPEDVSAGAAFSQAAFRLSRTDFAQSFSFGIPGTNAVYVLQLHEVAEAYLPAFEDIQEDALALAREIAVEEAFRAHVDAVHARMSEALASGKGFADAAESEGLSLTEVKPFTLFDADPRDIPFFGDMAPDLLPLQTGELTPPVRTVEGTVIAYVRLREPGALEERLAIKPDVSRMMASGLEHVHFNSWTKAILEEARK